MIKLYENAQTINNATFAEAIESINTLESSKNGLIYAILSPRTFNYLEDTAKFGPLFKALYNASFEVILNNIEKDTGLKINVTNVVNLIPNVDVIPLLEETIKISVKDVFIVVNNGEIITSFHGLLEPLDIAQFEAEYNVNYDDLKNLR